MLHKWFFNNDMNEKVPRTHAHIPLLALPSALPVCCVVHRCDAL